MLTPYVAQVLLKTSLYSAVSVYAVMGVIATITALLLPVETLGLQLTESGQQITKGRQELVNEEDDDDIKNTPNTPNTLNERANLADTSAERHM